MMRIVPLGEAAILVVVGRELESATRARIHRLAAAVRADADVGLGPPVPGAASVLVPFDPLVLDPATATARLAALAETVGEGAEPFPSPTLVELPTRYGGSGGPDLRGVAEACGRSEAEVAELHASIEYVVAFCGFAPGFAYLDAVPAAIAVPRRPTPRERIPAGSVGIADRRTAVYPGGTAGGWQLIGRTDATVWDATRTPPALLVPGTSVRFVRVG
jgi:KipI family sensor histidine kinase inhibitor